MILSKTQVIFFVIIILAFLHSMAFFDYNLPLFIFFAYLWNFNKAARLQVFYLILLSVIVDCLYVLYHTKIFDLKRAFIVGQESWTQSKVYFQFIKVSFSINLMIKIMLLLWIVIKKKDIKDRINFNDISKSLSELLFIN